MHTLEANCLRRPHDRASQTPFFPGIAREGATGTHPACMLAGPEGDRNAAAKAASEPPPSAPIPPPMGLEGGAFFSPDHDSLIAAVGLEARLAYLAVKRELEWDHG